MKAGILESDIERIGRVIADRYNLPIVFEKDRLYTDGRKIYLPRIENLDSSLRESIFALLDHQIAHINHSDFKVLRTGRTQFHNDLLMAAEDARVEALHMEDMPGTRAPLKALNDQLRSRLVSHWNELPATSRVVAMVRDVLMNRPLVNDPPIRRALASKRALFDDIREAGTTGEIKAVTDQMADLWKNLVASPVEDPASGMVDLDGLPHPSLDPVTDVVSDLPLTDETAVADGDKKKEDKKKEDKKKEDKKEEKKKDEAEKKPEGKPEDDEPEDGEPKEGEPAAGDPEDGEPEDGEPQESTPEDGEPKEGEPEEGEPEDGEPKEGEPAAGEPGDGESEDGEAQESTPEDGEPKEGEVEKPSDPARGGLPDEDDTLTDPDEDAPAALDVESMVNSRLGKAASKTRQAKSIPMAPSSTAFDKVTPHGLEHRDPEARAKYARLKSRVAPVLRPVQLSLEKIFKVRENARWSLERERGKLVSRSLSRLVSSPGYRTPFGEFRREETKNVAVEILVDLSGSMEGSKIVLARDACVAMAEALSSLDIPFEITGFTTAGETRMPRSTPGSHLRWSERMDYHVFRSFDDHSSTGIASMATGQQNPDGEAVLWAARRLSSRREKRRVMMVLSDGMPAASDQPQHVLEEHLRRVVAAVMADGIETVAIGIQTDAPAEFYPDSVVINSLEDLPRQALATLSEILLRTPSSKARTR